MENEKLCTVIMPSYNSGKTIKAAIDSALAQTYTNIEIMVYDGNSQDDTEVIVKEFQDKDTRVKFFKDLDNCGLAYARNFCIEKAAGDYIAFLDSDDVWLPNKLERQVDHMEKTGADVSYTSYSFIDEGGQEVKRPYIVPETTDYISLLKENVIGMSTSLVKAEVAKEYKMTKGLCEDYCYWLAMLKDGVTACGLSEVLTRYRLVESSRSFDKRKGAIARWRVLRKVEGIPLHRALCYFVNYAVCGLKKYR